MNDTVKPVDWLSERMIFGLLILAGYIGALVILSFMPIPAANSNLIAQGLGMLGGAVGVIVAAIWKTDKAERQSQEAMSRMAEAAVATSTNSGSSSGGPTIISPAGSTATIDPPAPAPVADPLAAQMAAGKLDDEDDGK